MSLKIFTTNIDEKALQQINELMALPAFQDCKVRIMPDVHAGAGCVIGFTADLGDKVIPNIVGVDIGCGMLTVPLGKIDIDYEKLDDVINEQIPHGMNVHDVVPIDFPVYFDLKELHCFHGLKNVDWLERSFGTLGGGNHFIEIDADDEGNKYLVIHTGSRNLGKQVAEYWQNCAIENMSGRQEFLQQRNELIARLKSDGRNSEIASALKAFDRSHKPVSRFPKDLCWLEGEDRNDYLDDMRFCQIFAIWNREKIALQILNEMHWSLTDEYACSPWALFDDAIELIKFLQAQLQNTKERCEEAENRLNRIVYCKDCKHFDDPNKCHVAKMCCDAGVDRFLLRDWNWYCGDGEGK